MKNSLPFIISALLFPIFVYGEIWNINKVEITSQKTDTIIQKKALNDIRFEGWTEKDWLDNEYIYTLRKYLDDYNSGGIDDSTLKFYKELTKGKFVIYDITPYFFGGAYIRFVFLNEPDLVFSSWIYSKVDVEKEFVKGYEVRFIKLEEERTDMTKEDILQAIKEMKGLKLW